MPRLLLFIFIILVTPGIACANLQSRAVKDGHVEAQLISETGSIQPGHLLPMAVRLTMDQGWHIYWKNPGDSGIPTKVQWILPDGFSAGPLQWPYPHKIEQPPLRSYGYEHEVFLLTAIDPPADLTAGGTKTFKARVDWLVCREGCIPGHADLEILLPVKNDISQKNSPWVQAFADTRFHLPIDHGAWDVAASGDAHNLKLRITSTKKYPLSAVYFFPDRDDLIDHAGTQILKEIDGGYELIVPRSSINHQPLTYLTGVLFSREGWRGPQTEQALAIDVPVGSSSTKADGPNIAVALLFAFVGGLILNLMPCVLPVLSLKILGLIQQTGEDRAKIRLHGLVFTSGVIMSFWILAGLLIILQAAGRQIGWGFQFQSPLFLVFLSALFFILALNLFGAFEILLPFQIQPNRQPGLPGSFFNGALATLTATPCTAPFMGTALGFALTQSPQIALIIFTSLALGMAFPYLMLCLFPSLLRFLPKPGAWMIRFKQFLGVLLIATVIWLLWVLGEQTGVIKDVAPQTTSSQIQWQTYSPELVDQLRTQKRIILIDFTAKWCLTCQANERIALDNPDVIKKFEELNVAAVKADWTSQNADITRALNGFGKNSIPLYVLYGKNSDEPVILPELITPKTVLEALDKLNR